ncbi:MAG: type II toxin-antitoxin system VapC family toxin [Actinomycetota bacterium]|nr:type II toxin-antitoxin system VapC family toxin [Pseudonocardiales bacterium]MDQ3600940.1 type II toxin-antitoxin system VapC family toxin [Actinomycetota bacterium]
MIVVLDASAAVKLVLDETGSDQVRRLWDEQLTIVAPSIVVPEVAAAIQAARRDGRVADAGAQIAHRSWVSLIEDIDVLAVDLALADRARELAATRMVRGMDAVYLAVALALEDASSVGLLSFDVRQRSGLIPEDGIHLLPADLG